ncbi:hypothetical protein [Eubacterium oxidoreducens]|uniref:Uncharacterized protein n=1 Tax=Eubacterium oxidoreducens TaxID=1732 RepID=A0A1G6B364_EUBOX|nr:hypothetical protein [Eubacterium oxidoreducens]SDB15100.1 hypothetical protein SAMN02910417_01112 [Eubacterium oxidoreducens]
MKERLKEIENYAKEIQKIAEDIAKDSNNRFVKQDISGFVYAIINGEEIDADFMNECLSIKG